MRVLMLEIVMSAQLLILLHSALTKRILGTPDLQGVDAHFFCTEELLDMISLKGTSTGKDTVILIYRHKTDHKTACLFSSPFLRNLAY